MKKNTFIYSAIIFAILFRLIPHPPNFTPISAIALFSGALLNKKQSFIIPLIAMFISDCALQLFFWNRVSQFDVGCLFVFNFNNHFRY